MHIPELDVSSLSNFDSIYSKWIAASGKEIALVYRRKDGSWSFYFIEYNWGWEFTGNESGIYESQEVAERELVSNFPAYRDATPKRFARNT